MLTKTKKPSSLVEAVQIVFDALQPFDDAARQRILASVVALFGSRTAQYGKEVQSGPSIRHDKDASIIRTDRPVSPIELLQDKHAVTNPQKIALFAFYRERVEGLTRFSKDDLKPLFAKAKQLPPKNYDRDYRTTISQGWIYDDGSESYLTSKGLEAVETGFGKPHAKGSRPKTSSRKKNSSKKGLRSSYSGCLAMIDDAIVLRAERLRDDVSDLLATLKQHYGSASSLVSSAVLKETAASIGERWLVELAARQDLKTIIKGKVLAELGLECQRLISYAEGRIQRGKYDKALKTILGEFRNEVIVPMKQARNQLIIQGRSALDTDQPIIQSKSVFIGQSFTVSDANMNDMIKGLVEAYGLPCSTGEKPRAESVSVKVRERIDEHAIFLGIFARRDKIKGKSEWTTSPWIIDEKAYAFAKGKKLILLKETGVGSIGGIQGDYEYVEFQRDALAQLFIKLIQIFTDLTRATTKQR